MPAGTVAKIFATCAKRTAKRKIGVVANTTISTWIVADGRRESAPLRNMKSFISRRCSRVQRQ